MSSNLYNVLSGIINNERGIITGLQNVKGIADRLNGIIVTSGDGTGFLADNGTYVNVGSQNLAPVVNGKIPAEYLPSYVDDVIEGYYRSNAFYATASGGSPMTGEAGKLYLDLTNNKNELYRWTGSAYVKVSGLNGDDLLAINNKISYVSGVVSGIHVNDSTITFKNGSTSLGTLTTNQSSAGTVQLSGLVPTVGAGTITLKNGTKTSANTFTANETGAKSVDIAALFSGYATGTINNKTVTFKNGSTTLGTLSTNQASNSEIQLSSMLNGIATTSNIPTVNDVTISFKNGSLTAADTFTTNASSAKAIQLSGILSGLALKSSIPTVNNKTVTFKNGSTTIGTLSTNQSTASEINFSSEFDKKQNVINSSNKLAYSNISGTPTIPTVNNNTITFKNGSTSIDSFTLNQNSDKTINLSGEFNKKQDVIDTSHKLSYSLISSQPTIPTVYNKTVTFKNGSTTLGTLSTNQSANSEIQLSSLITTANGAIGDGTISVKNGSTAIGSFTVNQSGNTEINLSSEFNKKQNVINSSNKLAYSNISGTPEIPTVNNKTITIKNGSTTISSFTLNQTTDATIDFGTEFNKKQDVIDSSHKLSYTLLTGTPAIPTVNNKTVTLKNGSTTIGTLSTNQSANSEINFSGEFDKKQDVIDSSHKLDYSLISSQPTIPSVGNATITFKNGNTSLGSFTTNQSSAGTIQLSSLITTANGAIGDGTITLKNGSTSIGSFTVNQSDAKEINLSSEFNKKQNVIDSSHKLSYTLLSSTPTIPIVNNNTITLKNGSTTISSFTLNQNSDVTVDFGAEFNKKQNVINSSNKLAYSNISGTPSIYNSTITLVNGSTSGDSFTVNANVAKNVQLSALFAEYATNTDLNYVSGIVNGLQAQANPEGTIAAFGAMSGNIVTATANFSNGYFVTSNGTAKTVEGKTLSKVTSISSPTDSQIPTAKAVSSLVSGTINYVTNSVSGKITTSDGTGTTAGNLVLTTGTNNKILSSSIASSKLVQSDGTGSTAGQVVVTTTTGNKILSSNITAANIVTAASNMTSGKIVTANGNKTIEGATLTKVTSITSGRTDNDIPTAKAVYAYTSGAVNKVSANDTTITIKDTQANISDSFTTNTSSAKTIELSGMFAKRECLSAVFPTGATTTAVAGQWLIMMNSANATVNLPSSGSSGQFIKVTVTSTAINGTQVNIGGSIYGQNGGTWGSLGNPLAVDIPETLTFVFASSHWNLIETNRL